MRERTKTDYLIALDNAHVHPESRRIIENLIDSQLSMVEHMKETSLWDIFEYEKTSQAILSKIRNTTLQWQSVLSLI